MASEQATAAAENIASWLRLEAHQFPSNGNVSEWAAIIDAAFAPVVALLREAREIQRLTLRMEHTRDAGEYDKADRSIKAIHDKIDALIEKEES